MISIGSKHLTIAKFWYDEKFYDIALTRDLKFRYSYFDKDNNLHLNLSLRDYSIIYFVLTSLKVDKKNSFFIRNEFISGRKYSIFFDENTRNFFWTNTVFSSDEDNIFLNMKYNHCCLTMSKETSSTEKLIPDADVPSGMYRKYVYNNSSRKWISIFCIGAFCLELLAGIIANEITTVTSFVQNPVTYTASVIALNNDSDRYDWLLIEEAINKNEKLTDAEKDKILKTKFIFDEYHQYMDLPVVISRLSSLEIIYNVGPNYWGPAGTYDALSNKITINEAANIDEVFADNTLELISTFFHELFHVFQNGIGNKFSECSNEVFTREAIRRLYMRGELSETITGNCDVRNVNDFGRGYQNIIELYYAVAELVPRDVLIQFQFSKDFKIIADALAQKGIARETAYRFFTSINSIELLARDIEKEKIEAYECLNEFYEKATNSNFNTDLFGFFQKTARKDLVRTDSQLGIFLCEETIGCNYASYKDQIYIRANWFPKTIFSDSILENDICFYFGWENGCLGALKQLGLRTDDDGNDVEFVLVVDEETEEDFATFLDKGYVPAINTSRKN